MEEVDVFTFIGRMVQHILPKGMQRIRYFGLHATAIYQKTRKQLRAILPTDAVQCSETFTVARKQYRQRVNVVFGAWSDQLASVTNKLTDELFAFHIAIFFNLCSWGTSSIAIIR